MKWNRKENIPVTYNWADSRYWDNDGRLVGYVELMQTFFPLYQAVVEEYLLGKYRTIEQAKKAVELAVKKIK